MRLNAAVRSWLKVGLSASTVDILNLDPSEAVIVFTGTEGFECGQTRTAFRDA